VFWTAEVCVSARSADAPRPSPPLTVEAVEFGTNAPPLRCLFERRSFDAAGVAVGLPRFRDDLGLRDSRCRSLSLVLLWRPREVGRDARLVFGRFLSGSFKGSFGDYHC
jgi:hypothetical protein